MSSKINLSPPILAPGHLLEAALPGYNLGASPNCTLIRRGYNDHYLVAVGDQQYVLRVYIPGKYYIRDPEDFCFELELLAFLRFHNHPVCAALPRCDGSLLGDLDTDGGARHFALFEFAQGEERRGEELDEEAAHRLGRVIAGLHVAGDEFGRSGGRYRLDEENLVDRPVATLRRLLGAEGDFLVELGQELKAGLAALPIADGAFGLIHGDLHPGNFRIKRGGGVSVFDFDHCGFGWRAYDLSVLTMSLSDPAWAALVEGYAAVRPFQPGELKGIGLLARVRALWDPGDFNRMAATGVWGARPPLSEEKRTSLLAYLRENVG